MKIAVIADVHGNYPALSAVVNDALEQKVDKFIFAGDYFMDLPYANEVVELIRNLDNAVVVQGNKEGYLAKGYYADWDNEQMGSAYQIVKELKPENSSYITGLEKASYVSLPYSGSVYVTHNIEHLNFSFFDKMSNDTSFSEKMECRAFSYSECLEIIKCFLTNDKSREIAASINAPVIIMGHTHWQWHGYCGGKLVVNPGSCGLPADYNTNAPYTILIDSNDGLLVEERRVPYDIEALIRYTKDTEIYKKGRIWCDLTFDFLRTAQNDIPIFFKIARDLASKKNETGNYFSNKTWNETYEIYRNTKGRG